MNSAAYMSAYMKRRYHERRTLAIVTLGGRCTSCGSVDNLELDHIDRATKSFDLGHMWSVSKARYAAELSKCQVLCRDCHKTKSIAERSVEHGGGTSGKRNCKCGPCRARKSEYNRAARMRRAGLLTDKASA